MWKIIYYILHAFNIRIDSDSIRKYIPEAEGASCLVQGLQRPLQDRQDLLLGQQGPALPCLGQQPWQGQYQAPHSSHSMVAALLQVAGLPKQVTQFLRPAKLQGPELSVLLSA
jgi:hypothetical protein